MLTENYYQKNIYSKINSFRKDTILKMIDKSKKDLLVLDVGCADGSLGAAIKKETRALVHGIDIVESQIEIARNKLDAVFCFNIESELKNWLPQVGEKKYDYIVISEVLEHFFYPEKVLGVIKNLLAVNGEIIITVPNILFWKNRLKIFFGKFEYTSEGLMDRGHIHFFTHDSLQKILVSQEYQIVTQNHHCPTRGTKFLSKVWPGLFAFQFIVKVRCL